MDVACINFGKQFLYGDFGKRVEREDLVKRGEVGGDGELFAGDGDGEVRADCGPELDPNGVGRSAVREP
jgi:hypothetical protein